MKTNPLQRKVKRQKRLKNTSTKTSSNSQKKPFISHIQELRTKLTWSVLVLVVGSVIGYLLRDSILKILLSPLNQPLYYTSPAGGFSFTFSLSLFFGFIVSLPFFTFQILAFVEPAIPVKARFSALTTLLSSCLLMILGMLFAYFVSLPAALHFLSKFGSGEVRSLISTSEYLSFVARYLIGFGILFELPLIMVFINKIHRLEIKKLLGFEKWIILISFAIAAILTPTPDIVNQIIMAVPIILLYQVSVLIVWFINRS